MKQSLFIFRRQIEVRKCVVYNEDIGRYGAWDADKCTTVMSEQSSTLCECYTTGTFGKNYSTNLSTIVSFGKLRPSMSSPDRFTNLESIHDFFS